MKNSLKSLVFGFLAIALALSFTSCGDESEDPKPSTPQYDIEDFLGYWQSTSVEYNGKTYTDVCDVTWSSTITNLRQIGLDLSANQVASDLVNFKCGSSNTIASMTATFNETTMILALDDVYEFKVSDISTTKFTAKLIKASAGLTVPLNGVYKFTKN